MKLDREDLKGKTLSCALEQGIDTKIALLQHYQHLGCLLAEEIRQRKYDYWRAHLIVATSHMVGAIAAGEHCYVLSRV